MKKCNLFCLAAIIIFVSSLACKGCFQNEKVDRVKRVSQVAQKNVIIKLKKLERDIFGGNEDGVRED